MVLAAVVNLEAQEAGILREATGRAVHGLWFRHWRAVDLAVAGRLHTSSSAMPFTLSPLMGLPLPSKGQVTVGAGAQAWFRLTALEAELSIQLQEKWLPRLPSELHLEGLQWRVTGYTTNGADHPWAGGVDLRALAEERLLVSAPPKRWRLSFATPTSFHGVGGHFPFPLPDVLLRSWLRRWQAFGPVLLPDDLPERAREGLAVSAYTLKTVPVRDRRRVMIGFVGQMTLRALKMTPGERAAVDLLMAYAFWAGSGHHTTQGMGLTRLLPERRQYNNGATH